MKTNQFIKKATLKVTDHAKWQKTEIKKSTDFSEWFIHSLLPKSKTVKQLKAMERKDAEKYLFNRVDKKAEKEISELTGEYSNIMQSKDIESINISVEWKKSATWGSNPTATATVNYTDNCCSYFEGKASGCGYDKESTAVAAALNNSYSVLKLLFECGENDPDNKIYGYRNAKDGYFPHISGGVGVSCYNSVFNLCGFKFEKTNSGKTFDCYLISKK